jgi:transposase InsO family protein
MQDRQSCAIGRHPAGPCSAPRTIWSAAHPCRTVRRGPNRQPQTSRTSHAPAGYPRAGAAPLSCVHNRQQALPAGSDKPARAEFVAHQPDQVWLADITYIPTGEGWLYLAVVLDLFTRKVVGWAMREHMRAELTIAALTMAIQRQRLGAGLIHHSDRGGHA